MTSHEGIEFDWATWLTATRMIDEAATPHDFGDLNATLAYTRQLRDISSSLRHLSQQSRQQAQAIRSQIRQAAQPSRR